MALAGMIAAVIAAAMSACNAGDSADSGPAPRVQSRPSVTNVPTATTTSTPAPLPTVVLPPGGEAPSGGDQPSGPPPAPRVGSLPENAASAEFMTLQDALRREIDAYRASTGTDAAIAVTDLQTSETISVQGNVAKRNGCTINMYALLAITSEFEAGRGDPASVAASVRSGIGDSYPPQVRAFLEVVFGDFHRGEQRARELMSSWGMSASLFDHVPYYGNGTQNNLLTALENNQTWTKLYRGQLFDGQWTSYALARLHEIKPGLNYIIPGQLPPQASVAHKIGYYHDIDGWVVADAGVVTFADRTGQQRAYVVTYLSERAPTEAAGYSFGARLSRMVWDWMHPRYFEGAPPTDTPTRTPRPSTAVPTRTPRPPRTPTLTPVPTLALTPAPSLVPTQTALP